MGVEVKGGFQPLRRRCIDRYEIETDSCVESTTAYSIAVPIDRLLTTIEFEEFGINFFFLNIPLASFFKTPR